MREILFRGKQIENGEWVYGFYTHIYSNPNQDIILTGNICIYEDSDEHPLEAIIVDPTTIGQYTGLTDKNGKKIFEGDIVKLPNNSIDNYSIDIVYDVGHVVIHNHRDMGLDTDFTVWDGCELEIIGNIHDDPELLKGE